MKPRNCTIAVIFLFCYSQQSCKKNESTTNPPSLKSDTLTTGWTKKTTTGEYQLNDIFFNSSSTGYLSAARIYKTTDGGNTWNPVSNYHFAYNIAVTTNNKVFVAAQTNEIYSSFDGGASFSTVNISTEPLDIFFVDNSNGYCVTPDGLYHTTNGGANWVKIITSGLPNGWYGYNASIFCINNSTGWIAGPDGIYRSLGSMGSWAKASTSGGIPFYFSAIHATSANIIYAANYNGEIYKSIDGGINFSFIKKLETDSPTGLEDIHFINSLLGYASIGRCVYITTDGAVTWTKVVSTGEGVLGEMHFTDANHGWVIGDNRYANEAFVLTFKQ